MSEIHYVTAEGLEKLKAELAEAISQRPVISKQIAEARDKGDLSENAEYDAAKEAQGLLELKISKLENLVANARVIDESKISTDHVQMLTKVTLHRPVHPGRRERGQLPRGQAGCRHPYRQGPDRQAQG